LRHEKQADPRLRYYDPATRGWLPGGRVALHSFRAPYVLHVVYGPGAGLWYPVFPGAHLTIGRSRHCDVVLPDASASREHALLTCQRLHCRIQDLGSMNMTFVNGEPAWTGQDLRPGDHLRCGNTVLRLDATGWTGDAPGPYEGINEKLDSRA
jgi:hypothetical protein